MMTDRTKAYRQIYEDPDAEHLIMRLTATLVAALLDPAHQSPYERSNMTSRTSLIGPAMDLAEDIYLSVRERARRREPAWDE